MHFWLSPFALFLLFLWLILSVSQKRSTSNFYATLPRHAPNGLALLEVFTVSSVICRHLCPWWVLIIALSQISFLALSQKIVEVNELRFLLVAGLCALLCTAWIPILVPLLNLCMTKCWKFISWSLLFTSLFYRKTEFLIKCNIIKTGRIALYSELIQFCKFFSVKRLDFENSTAERGV